MKCVLQLPMMFILSHYEFYPKRGLFMQIKIDHRQAQIKMLIASFRYK